MTDTIAQPLADELLECLRAAVSTLDDPPGQVCMRAGDVVNFLISLTEDECCTGLAWVRVTTVYPSIDFPEPQATLILRSAVLTPSWAVGLEMGVVRCAPTSGAATNPTCAQWTNAAEAVNDDAAAMREALCCFIENHKGVVLPGIWEPLAVEGGCVGGFMQLLVRSTSCQC